MRFRYAASERINFKWAKTALFVLLSVVVVVGGSSSDTFAWVNYLWQMKNGS